MVQGRKMAEFDPETLKREMIGWRHDLHAHPEFGFEEKRTAAFVAAKLREFGLDDVVEGIGGTGVVGTLKRYSGNRAIALRADMDALRIAEQSAAPYRCGNPGIMHARGHDGHTTRRREAAGRAGRLRRHRALRFPAGRRVGKRRARHARWHEFPCRRGQAKAGA